MAVNPLPRILAAAAVVGAAALVLTPADAATPVQVGEVCVMMGPRTTCRASGNVEIHSTSAPTARLAHGNWSLLRGGPRMLGHR
jgi:hypothetical protein